jgi:hypothetical protein
MDGAEGSGGGLAGLTLYSNPSYHGMRHFPGHNVLIPTWSRSTERRLEGIDRRMGRALIGSTGFATDKSATNRIRIGAVLRAWKAKR